MAEHVTQIGTGANNCGPASVEFVRRLYKPSRRISVQRVRADMGGGGGFTSLYGIEWALDWYGIPAYIETRATLDFYEQMLAERRPVIGLFDYRAFYTNPPPTLTVPYTYAHFAPVVGSRDGLFWLHDPLYLWGPVPVTRAEFILAISSRSRYIGGTNDPYLAVVPHAPYTVGMEQRAKIRSLLENYANVA